MKISNIIFIAALFIHIYTEENNYTNSIDINEVSNLTDFNNTYSYDVISKENPEHDSKFYDDIDNINVNKTIYEEKVLERERWEQQVSNFIPSDLLTFLISEKDKEYFYEDITQTSLIRIAFITDSMRYNINFHIYDNKNNLIDKVIKSGQYYYEFYANQTGQYKFVFTNNESVEKKITFAIHSGNNTDPSISSDHFEDLLNKISKIDKRINDAKMKQNFLNKKYEGHFDDVRYNNKRIVSYTIFEIFVMIVIFISQILYLKYLLDKSP